MLIGIFPPSKLVQQHGESADQLNFPGKGTTSWDARSGTSAMHFSLRLFVLLLPVQGLFNGVRLHCGLGFVCPFFTNLLPSLG